MNKKNAKDRNKRILGSFMLEDGNSVNGELKLKGASTLLKLHSDKSLDRFTGSNMDVEGTAYSGECLTLINCLCVGVRHKGWSNKGNIYHADIFPHYVAIGREHLKSSEKNIKRIEFTTTDLSTIFYDFDAFGSVIDTKSVIDIVLKEIRNVRSVDSGDMPIVSYFTGKMCVAEIFTTIGKISVHHRPSWNSGSPSGVSIKNRMVISIEPESPIVFNDAMNKMEDLAGFLSMLAGRVQEIKDIQIFTNANTENPFQSITIHHSLRCKSSNKNQLNEPHAADIPVNAIFQPEEFRDVLANWISRQSTWRIARSRSLNCLQKGNNYGPDRLVAAANMFDILPSDATPISDELSIEIIEARDKCKQIFKSLPDGVDRSSVLGALGRIGKPSLPKKVAYRVAIVNSKFGERFQDLDKVATLALKCRNYFVHGSTDFEFGKIEHLSSFLTNTLEFIFAASDLIEAGWDAYRWNGENHGWGHTFSRFMVEYQNSSLELLHLTKKENK